LASSPLCLNQAFKFGNTIYALQFHLEIDALTIDTWLNVLENRREIANLNGAIDPKSIRDETPRRMERLTELSHQLFGEFIKLLNAY
jgi:GMP synthase (glutamine-hydrolysing)